jgi:GAGA factor
MWCKIQERFDNEYNFMPETNIFFLFSVSALRSHSRECGVGAPCPLCPKVVTQKRNLAKHMEKHKRDGLWQHANFNVIKDEIHI